jgi:hypothetical protein
MKCQYLRVVLLVSLMSSFAMVLPAEGSGQVEGFVRPTLNCVSYDRHTNSLSAVFGYVSTFPTPVTLPVGHDNFFPPILKAGIS